MNTEDKLNIIFNQIDFLKNNDNKIEKDIIKKINLKINELNSKIDKNELENKDQINKKDKIINEMKEKIIEKENIIQAISNKIENEINKNNNDKIELNKKIFNLSNIIKEKEILINDILKKYNNIKEEMKKINYKLLEHENAINNNNIKKEEKINDIINNIDNKINNKFNEQVNHINNKIKKYIHDLEYAKKINYEFVKEPNFLKFKSNITTMNTKHGNDIFEVFVSYKYNEEFLVSPNSNNFNLDIYKLRNNQIVVSIPGHKNHVTTVRYFINNITKNEYLISADLDKIVILFDITNNYNIRHKINTFYADGISSCLLIFSNYKQMNNFYIITSSISAFGNNDNSSTKIYILDNYHPIKYIKNTNNSPIFHLLSWYNNLNKKYYIIQFSSNKILINDLLTDEIYAELIKEPESNNYSGFIYSANGLDILFSCSIKGYVKLWNLYNKNCINCFYYQGCSFTSIIGWNKNYIIATDYDNKLFKIFDVTDFRNIKDFSINSGHNGNLVCIKKINHPIYGESLLSAARDNSVKLWVID